MRLVRFDEGRLGIVDGDDVVDISDVGPVPVSVWPPVAELAVIADFERLRPTIEARRESGERIPLSSVRLLSPIAWPNKLLGMPANYHDHIVEMRSSNRADLNGFFLKASSCLSGASEPIVLPAIEGREVHHECELGVVIGRAGRHISASEALDHVFGYSCLVDMTVRGTEERVMRKSFDTFCPLGPWIVTTDELPDPSALSLELSVNGQIRQRANTRDLIVGIAEMIELISAVVTLQPGDVIASGTPAGVGPLSGGDVVVISIEGIGSMSLDVVQGDGGSNVAFEQGNVRAARAGATPS